MLAYLLRQRPPPSKNNAFSDDKEISKELDAATKALFSAFNDKELVEKLRNLPATSKKEILSDISSKLFEPVGKPLSSLPGQFYFGVAKEGYCYWNSHSINQYDNRRSDYGLFYLDNSNVVGSPIIPFDESCVLVDEASGNLKETINTTNNFILCKDVCFSPDWGGMYQPLPNYSWTFSPTRGVVYVNDENEAKLYEFSKDDIERINLGIDSCEDIYKFIVSKGLKKEGNLTEAEKVDKNRNLTFQELVDAGNVEEALILLGGNYDSYDSNDRMKYVINSLISKSNDEDMEEAIKWSKLSNASIDTSDMVKMSKFLVSKGRNDEVADIVKLATAKDATSKSIEGLCKSGKDEDLETAILIAKLTGKEYVDSCYVVQICDYLVSKGRIDEAEGIIFAKNPDRSYGNIYAQNTYDRILERIKEKYTASVSERIKEYDKYYEYCKGHNISYSYQKAVVEMLMHDPRALSKVVGDLLDGKKLLELNKLLKLISEYNK